MHPKLSEAFEALTHENRVELAVGLNEPSDTLPPSDASGPEAITLRCPPPDPSVWDVE